MTTIFESSSTCSVCGATSEYIVIGSTNSFGPCDLDLRPPQMKRSTMNLWVQECPECGYCAKQVTDNTSVTRAFLESSDYKCCSGIRFRSDLAVRFYKHYMVALRDGAMTDAFFALLHAAWACDDENDTENAIACRKASLPLVNELIIIDDCNRDTFLVLKADIMRRAGLFDELVSEYSNVSVSDETLKKLIAFEIDRTEHKDTLCYTVANAIEDN